MVMIIRRLEWFGLKEDMKLKTTEQLWIMKMEGKRPRGRPKLRWKDTVRRTFTETAIPT